MIRCKYCKSTNIQNAGFIVLKEGRVQRYKCMECEKTFRQGTGLVYTPEIIEFMKECAKKGLTSQEAKKKSEVKFKRTFNIYNFRNVAVKKGIFFRPPLNEIISSSHIKKFIEEKHKKLDIFTLRDKIIEKFEENISLSKIKEFIKRRTFDK